FVDALVVGADANDAIAIGGLFVEQFRSGKRGENRDSRLFYLACEPLHETVDGDDIVAMILQRRRRDRELVMILAGEEVNRFFVDLGVEWRFALESGKQLFHGSRVEESAGKTMLPGFARF